MKFVVISTEQKFVTVNVAHISHYMSGTDGNAIVTMSNGTELVTTVSVSVLDKKIEDSLE